MTRFSSSSAISSMEVVVSTTATFLVGGTVRGAGRERGTVYEGGAGRGHVAFLSTAETVSFFETFFLFFQSELLGFSLVSTSMALGSLEGVSLVGVGVWKVTGVLDECCLATEAAKCHSLRNWLIFSYHPLGVVGITSIP